MLFQRDKGINQGAITLTNLVIKFARSGHDSGYIVIFDDQITVDMKGFENDMMYSPAWVNMKYHWSEEEYAFFMDAARIDNRGRATIEIKYSKSTLTHKEVSRLIKDNAAVFTEISKKGQFVSSANWSYRSSLS